MVDLTTTYAGLKLKSPIIAASSSLTASTAKIKTFAEAGAGAVILKSIFEEQIQNEAADTYDHSHDFPEAYNYIKEYSEEHSIRQHVQLVREVALRSSRDPLTHLASPNSLLHIAALRGTGDEGSVLLLTDSYHLSIGY